MLFLAFVLLYKLAFNKYTAHLIVTPFITKQFFQKPVQFEWERFSLFFGFGIRNLRISEHKDSVQNILTASKIHIYYNLPLVFLGKFEISEILIENLNLNIRKKENIWNISQILKVDESSPQTQTNQESLEEIHTFIPITLGAKIQIYNSSLEILDEDEDLHLGLKIPNIELDFETKRDNTIPLSLKILELPKKFFFQLGEKEKEYKLFIKTKNSKIETNLVTFLEILKVKQELPVYDAELTFQTRNLKIHLPQEEISTQAEIQYNLKFEENSDSLAIEKFQILLGKESEVQLKGNIKNISRSPEYSIQSKKFSFNFNEIGYLLKKTNLVNFEIGGSLDFSTLEIFGTLENLKLNLTANGNNLLYKSSNSLHSIKYLKVNSKANLNLVGQTPVIPYIKTLKIEPLELEYNSSNIKLVGNIEDLLEARLNLENFPIENYVSALSGRINGNMKLNGKNIEDLKTELSFFWKGFRILQSDFMTNYANLSGKINGSLSFQKGFSLGKISLNSLDLNLLNNFNGNALNLKGSQISISLTPLIIDTKSFLMSTNLRAVLLILPLSLADTISDLRSSIGDEVSIFSNFELNLEKGILVKGNFYPKFPHLSLNDSKIQITTHIDYDSRGSIDIQQISLTSLNDNLKGELKGKLYKRERGVLGNFEPNLELYFQLYSAGNSKLRPNLSFSGDIGLNLKFEKSLINGKLYSNQSNFLVETGKCPGADCKLFLLEGFQMNVPIQHDLGLKSEFSLLLDEKSKFIQNNPISRTYNLSLRRVVGSHPFRENTSVEYIKQIGNEPGLKGIIEYKQNIFRLENLKINSLNGYIYGKNLFLNLQPVFPNKLEYLATLQIRDIDLRELLKPNVAKRIDDGKITADINISGKNLVDFIENINIFLSVYKLGKDFGKSALNVIMSSNLLQDYLITSYSIDKIELELSRGLVYANVLFKPGILPTLFLKVENNLISLERMPISNFLSRAREEIQTYE